MDKMQKRGTCSPYLQRPLRSLDQALRDQADTARREDGERRLQRLEQPMPLAPRLEKLAS